MFDIVMLQGIYIHNDCKVLISYMQFQYRLHYPILW